MFQKKIAEEIKTHILCSIALFVNRAVCDIMWKKCCTDGQTSDDNIKWRMRIVCCIPKARNTHSEYVTLMAFPLQQWLHERASVLRCTYTACLCFNTYAATLLAMSRWQKSHLTRNSLHIHFNRNVLKNFLTFNASNVRRFSRPLYRKKRWQNL